MSETVSGSEGRRTISRPLRDLSVYQADDPCMCIGIYRPAEVVARADTKVWHMHP